MKLLQPGSMTTVDLEYWLPDLPGPEHLEQELRLWKVIIIITCHVRYIDCYSSPALLIAFHHLQPNEWIVQSKMEFFEPFKMYNIMDDDNGFVCQLLFFYLQNECRADLTASDARNVREEPWVSVGSRRIPSSTGYFSVWLSCLWPVRKARGVPSATTTQGLPQGRNGEGTAHWPGTHAAPQGAGPPPRQPSSDEECRPPKSETDGVHKHLWGKGWLV